MTTSRRFVIGYMACGKTTYAQALAHQSGATPIDLDALIEQREGCSISTIFNERGETYFREIERATLLDLISTRENVVIATGGGTPCFFDNIHLMNAHGETIFLDVPLPTLVARLRHEREHRPLLSDIPEDQLPEIITRQRAARLPFYEQAHVKVMYPRWENLKRDNITVELVRRDKKRYLTLLLEGDEQESMIDLYLQRGDLFVMREKLDVKAVAVVSRESHDMYELKNLAVHPTSRRQGLGRAMLDFLWDYYAPTCQVLELGTGDSPITVPFYERCGFVYVRRIPDFFTAHYDHPIIEGGRQLRDMLYFQRKRNATENTSTSTATHEAPLVTH